MSTRRLASLEGLRMAELEGRRIVQFAGLFADRLGDFRAAVAGIDAPEAGGGIKHLAAVMGRVMHILGGDEQAGFLLELAVCGKRHPERPQVVGRGIQAIGHVILHGHSVSSGGHFPVGVIAPSFDCMVKLSAGLGASTVFKARAGPNSCNPAKSVRASLPVGDYCRTGVQPLRFPSKGSRITTGFRWL